MVVFDYDDVYYVVVDYLIENVKWKPMKVDSSES